MITKMFLFANAAAAAPANLPWPMPSDFTSGTNTVTVDSGNFMFDYSSVPSDMFADAVSRHAKRTFTHIGVDTLPASIQLTGLDISVVDADESHPQLETDESYTLTVPADGTNAKLHAQTIYGAMHGLESFSQLVMFNYTSEGYEVANAPWTLTDSPRFQHRGLMVDTARHYETIPALLEIIDSLTYAKVNVLHWHMVDGSSFPMQFKTYPKLWDAAYSSQERYLQSDIAQVVDYAHKRGVRVMVEFDVPGHASSWCKGYPEICPSPTCQTPLNVANNKTFEVIGAMLKECTGGKTSQKGQPSGLFPDNFLHLGGDEVNTGCWSQTEAVADWLKDQNMTADQGYAYFAKRASQIAISNGRRPVQWSEVFDHFKDQLDKRTIVHIWKSVTNVTEVVALGYNVLLNVGYDAQSWYLDNLNVKWDAVYSQEPCAGVPDSLCDKILGGHGEMWGETVDASDLEQTVWPRQAAIAERLWSPREVNDPAEALQRIENFRCLLNERGIRAAPVNNANARSSPPGPGSCYNQR